MGNRQNGDILESSWEILLDLCHSVYSINNLLPTSFFADPRDKEQDTEWFTGLWMMCPGWAKYGGSLLSVLKHVKKGNIISGLTVAAVAFLIALVVNVGSEALIKTLNNIAVKIILLLVVIFIGIIFDVIGTAAAAAELPPFNAKAAKKVFGAYQAVKITKNASLVASYCNDVIGDIAGTLSGAIGASIVFSLIHTFSFPDVVLTGAAMTSIIAALTIGGKAIGKNIAIERANSIIFKVAKLLGYWEKATGIEIFNNRR